MAINKLALIRYKTIDACFQNRFRKWTLEDLVEACSQAIYEYEGIHTGVSKRTVQLDLQNMRSDKLGYEAPIIVSDKKYYSYADKNYSITNSPITGQDLQTLSEVLGVLNQFKGFGYFKELNSMVTRLEDKLLTHKNKGKSYIDFEKNDLLKGLQFIDPLHKSILKKQVLQIEYQSFKSRQSSKLEFHPYLLKEYRNRWFLLGVSQAGKKFLILALDRISTFKPLKSEKYLQPNFDILGFFDNVIGVSKMPNQQPISIVFWVNRENAPYLKTKPMHASQQVQRELKDGTIFSMEVIWNFELEREILGFGESLRVISPKRLAGKIVSRLKIGFENYKRAFEAE